MNYTVNLGCWGSVFAVPTSVVDNHLKIAGSAQLKVLLYILRHSGTEFSEEDIAEALNMSKFDVKDCIEFWTNFDVISMSDGEILPAKGKPQVRAKTAEEASVPVSRTAETVSAPTAEAVKAPVQEKPSDTVVARPIRPDPIYVAKRVNDDEEIASLLNEAQYILGRPVSPNENAGMIMLHDNEGLPCEVILMLLTYCTENQLGMRQMENLGASWAKQGILTLEQADGKIRQMEESKEAYRKVQSILGLEFRKASKKEEELYSCWINTWHFSNEMISAAYDRCVDAKGKYIPNYVNTILKNWFERGIKTPDQAAEEKKSQPKGGEKGTNSSFDVGDLSSLGMFDE